MIVFVRYGPLCCPFSVALFEHGWVHKCASSTANPISFFHHYLGRVLRKIQNAQFLFLKRQLLVFLSWDRKINILEPLPVMKPTASWPVFALFSTSRSIGKKSIPSESANSLLSTADCAHVCVCVCFCTVRRVFSRVLIIQSRGLGLGSLTSSVRGACGLHLVSQ